MAWTAAVISNRHIRRRFHRRPVHRHYPVCNRLASLNFKSTLRTHSSRWICQRSHLRHHRRSTKSYRKQRSWRLQSNDLHTIIQLPPTLQSQRRQRIPRQVLQSLLRKCTKFCWKRNSRSDRSHCNNKVLWKFKSFGMALRFGAFNAFLTLDMQSPPFLVIFCCFLPFDKDKSKTCAFCRESGARNLLVRLSIGSQSRLQAQARLEVRSSQLLGRVTVLIRLEKKQTSSTVVLSCP